MAIYLKLYDEKTRMYPSGTLATKEQVYADYPAVEMFPHVIGTSEDDSVIYSISSLATLRTQYNISSEVSDEEAVQQIQEIMNTPSEPVEPEPTAEERIAAALEYQNLLSL